MCVLRLLLVLVALVPSAHASCQPDPLWIAGIYDDADFDEAIVAVSVAGVVETVVLLRRPTGIPAGAVRPHGTLLSAAAPSSTFSIRAPPS